MSIMAELGIRTLNPGDSIVIGIPQDVVDNSRKAIKKERRR